MRFSFYLLEKSVISHTYIPRVSWRYYFSEFRTNGALLLSRALLGFSIPKREIPNFAGMRLAEKLMNFRAALSSLRCYLTKGFEGAGPPLLNRDLSELLIANAKFQISPGWD